MSHSAQAGVAIYILVGEQWAPLRLRLPLAVEIDSDDEGYVAKVASPNGISAFGTGSTMHSALMDMSEVMRAEAASLRARRKHLAHGLELELSVLEQLLAPAGAESRPQVYIGAPVSPGASGPAFNTPPARNSYIPFPAAAITA